MRVIFSIVIASIIMSFIACGKKSSDTTTPLPPTDTTSGGETKEDVYLVGTIALPGYQSFTAAYWKNDSLVQLTADSTGYSRAETVTVSGTDVYIGGGNLNKAVYWKNGTMIMLPSDLYSYISAITIKETDIYAAGQNGLRPGYWKNGQAIPISADSIEAGQVSDMAIAGNDVYLAGHEYKFSAFHVATLWKNGTPVHLTDTSRYLGTSALRYSDASGTFADGSDIYVCGYEVDSTGNHFIAEYWKNGQRTALTDGSSSFLCRDIVVKDGDVYITGEKIEGKIGDIDQARHAVLWKNGILQNISSSSNNSSTAQMTIAGSDLYMILNEYNSTNTYVRYLKNNTSHAVTDGTLNGSASGIYVVRK